MIHILFLILKMIGWILLILLALLLLLILIVLFHPVRYRVHAEGKNTLDSLNADGRMNWLFHLISASVHYEHGELNWNLRLAWKRFNDKDEKEEDRPEQVKESVREEKKEKLPKAESKKEKFDKTKEDRKSEEVVEVAKTRERVNQNKKNKPPFFQRIRNRFLSLFEKIKYTFQKLCATIKKAEKKKEFLVAFVTYEKHKRAFDKMKKELRRLLQFLKPRKFQADLTFGFSDPSWTGYVLAFLGSVYGLIGEYVQIRPDFEERRLEGNVYVEGKIRVIFFVIPAWNLFWDKDVKITYKHIRKYM